MIFDNFSYIKTETLSGDIRTDVKNMLLANGKYDMSLFVADKLVWDQKGIPPFYDSVNAALAISLEMACYRYMEYMVENDMILCPHENWTAAYEQLKNRQFSS